ncbi:hypothetical protein H4219_001693 [Mycoemilia scoparia]|uniref:Uncharacterized protein n=1 Tax=Mycoemilia scoparia TaxID=417184 RepID=A0A9W8DRK4_9FUNG|nr:hypothetical protein H4219_001693 [Mycoemilia scoparia]
MYNYDHYSAVSSDTLFPTNPSYQSLPLENGLVYGIDRRQLEHMLPKSSRCHYHTDHIKSAVLKSVGDIYVISRPVSANTWYNKKQKYLSGEYANPCTKTFCFRSTKLQVYNIDIAEIFRQFIYYYQQFHHIDASNPTQVCNYFDSMFKNLISFLNYIPTAYDKHSVLQLTNLGALTCQNVFIGNVNHMLSSFGLSEGDCYYHDNHIVRNARNLALTYHRAILATPLISSAYHEHTHNSPGFR